MKSKWIDWSPSKRGPDGKAIEYTGQATFGEDLILFCVFQREDCQFPAWKYHYEGAGREGFQGIYSNTASGSKRRCSRVLRAWLAEGKPAF